MTTREGMNIREKLTDAAHDIRTIVESEEWIACADILRLAADLCERAADTDAIYLIEWMLPDDEYGRDVWMVMPSTPVASSPKSPELVRRLKRCRDVKSRDPWQYRISAYSRNPLYALPEDDDADA